MGGAMKGLNDMEFKFGVGDIVRIKNDMNNRMKAQFIEVI